MPAYKRKDPMDAIYCLAKDIIPKPPLKPKGPKRPLSSFFRYSGDRRHVVKEDNPELKFTEIQKIIGEEWKKINKKDKKKYETEYKEEQKEWKEKQKKFKASHKYKNYVKEKERWEDLYQEEYELQKYEREQKRKKRKAKKEKEEKNKDKRKGKRGKRKS
eukprot:809552_1